MSPDDVQAALETEDPLRLYLADGHEHDILDPKTVLVGETSIVVGVYDAGQRFPRWRMFALKNIVSIRPLTPAEI